MITVAKTAGFCFGVNRAITIVNELLAQGKRVATLGPIIHNAQVVSELEAKGVITCERVSDVPNDYVLVIRSHGVPKETYREIQNAGLNYVDATCPFVEKIHRIVEQADREGKPILIAGDPTHPEVLGIRGFAEHQPVFCYQTEDELSELLKKREFLCKTPIINVFQTTFNKKISEKCKKKLKKDYTSVVFFDTICDATSNRQTEAERLARQSDCMIVVGGKHSSNTVKLFSLCSSCCPTIHIETADELRDYDFSGYARIGVTAGASTPSGIIKEVQKTMSEIIDKVETTEAEASTQEQVADPATTKESEVAQEVPVAAEENVQPDCAESTDDEPTEPEKSFDEMTDMEAFEYSLNHMNSDQRVKGYVLAVTPSEIQVDIGRKHAGFVPMNEYSYDPDADAMKEVKVGDVLDLIVMRTNDQEGTVMLSKKRFDSSRIWDDLSDAEKAGTVLEGKVTEVIKGGVMVNSKGIRVFVPASQATASRTDSLDDLLNTNVNFRILEVNRARRRAVGSIRSVLRDQRKEQEAAFWADIEEGKVYTGKVKSLTSYGAFVDLGGVDGMVHISELSWKRIKNPSDVVAVGDVIEVFVKSFDAEKRKISLGYKKAEDNPWFIFLRDYHVDDVVTVKVVSMTAYGAFANIMEGIDGLIHISQISNTRIAKPQDVLTIGQEVEVKITQIDEEKKRISLSIRALLPEEEPVAEEAVEEPAAADEAVEEAAPAEETAPAEDAAEETAPAEEAAEETAPAEEAAE